MTRRPREWENRIAAAQTAQAAATRAENARKTATNPTTRPAPTTGKGNQK